MLDTLLELHMRNKNHFVFFQVWDTIQKESNAHPGTFGFADTINNVRNQQKLEFHQRINEGKNELK